MPKTRPRSLRLGGVELSLTLERTLAEKVQGGGLYRLLFGTEPTVSFSDGEPAIQGIEMEDIDWYQSIELGDGRITPGFVDHRDQVHLYGLPDSLQGKRCLDVATADGFWAFEMEKRGASEVLGIDVYSLRDCDFPSNYEQEVMATISTEVKGKGFAYAKRALNSKVQRRVLSVYELSPKTVGMFDFVFVSDLLLHLREPLRALEAVWTVAAGQLIVADAVDPELESSGLHSTIRFMVNPDEFAGHFWWRFSSSALEWMIRLARFQDVRKISEFVLPTRGGIAIPKVVFQARAE